MMLDHYNWQRGEQVMQLLTNIATHLKLLFHSSHFFLVTKTPDSSR